MIIILTQDDLDRRIMNRRDTFEAEQAADIVAEISRDGSVFRVIKTRSLDMGPAKNSAFGIEQLHTLVKSAVSREGLAEFKEVVRWDGMEWHE